MLLAIQVFHLIGLSMLLGGGICNAVLLNRAGTSDDTARTALRSASRRIGQISFIGLLLLWGSGVYMVSKSAGGWMDFPTLFWGKMVAVVLLSVSALAAQMFSIMAMFSGSRTPREKVIRMTAITTLLTLVALTLAVWAFYGSYEAPTADMPAAPPVTEAPALESTGTPAEVPAVPEEDVPLELPPDQTMGPSAS